MDSEYLYILIVLSSIFYSFKFYSNNTEVIAKIKWGKTLFFLQAFSGLVFVLIVFGVINGLIQYDWKYLLLFLPFAVASIWFTYQFYKMKNSVQDYIYLGAYLTMVGIVFIFLF